MKKNIAIVGGGSAGYFTALFLKKKYPSSNITLIESNKIPIIGVGEATTPRMLRLLHHDLEIPVKEFFQKVKPTIKLGVRFVWGKAEDGYYYHNPFGKSSINDAIHYSNYINNCCISSLLMEDDKAPLTIINDSIKPINLTRGFAYHIDNKLLVTFLKEKREEFGINHIDTLIENVKYNEDGAIKSLVDENGNNLSFDLYFDCSGFRSQLLGNFLKTDFVSYEKSLFTDRAITGSINNGGNPRPFTTGITMKHGWLWNTPLRTEDHLGYVYDSSCCTDEEAENEFKEKFPSVKLLGKVQFKSGRREVCWKNNVIAVGNSFAFIEPLESTGIHMILTHLKHFHKVCSSSGVTDEARKKFNHKINKGWDGLRDFIAIHFKFNTKLDTPFWKKCNLETDVSGIQDYLDYYKEFGPVTNNKSHPLNEKMNTSGTFGAYAHDINIAGCGYKEEKSVNEKTLNPKWPVYFELNKKIAANALTHNEALNYLDTYDTPKSFIKDWFSENGE